ncbi:MAG: hypothetical protein DHS20C21_20530 [Gemmatimonadota bacterium]|nr:MAG: hypothetical protein DHS20C21_20530 [Gemmatimonadota bacterium]
MVLVDAGGFTGGQSATFEPRALFMAEMMKELNYDAMTLGAKEAALGADMVRALASDPTLPLVSANLRDAETGELLLPAMKVVMRGDVRVGITAVSTLQPDRLEEIDIHPADAVESLRAVVPDLRERCDVLVLLCRSGLSEAKHISSSLEQSVDVVVVGNGKGGRGPVTPETGGSLYLTAATRGQSMGLARLLLPKGDAPLRMAGDEIVLSRDVPEDPDVEAVVSEFMKNLNASLAGRGRAAATSRTSPDGHYFVGAKSCGECHEREYERWLETPHSIAFDTLILAESESLPECYSCHVTGHNDAAGYDPSVDRATQLVNVQCEVCHDKGSRHARDGTYGDSLLMNACVTCHNQENSPDFDPELYWLMMEH